MKQNFTFPLIFFWPFLCLGQEGTLFSEQGPGLFHLAKKMDCYFTIEETCTESGLRLNEFKFYCQSFRLNNTYRNLEELIDDLKNKITEAIIFRESKESRIIHIVDKNLYCKPNYALNNKTSIEYQGSLGGLLDELWKRKTTVKRPNQGIIGFGIISGDGNTIVKVKAQEESNRAILTKYLPLSKYRRLLWVAETNKELSETNVYFKGQKRGIFYNKAITIKMTPFSEGEIAYYDNWYWPNALEEAKKYIAKKIEEKNDFQLRWAMLFLGAKKDEKSIPLLIQHVEYYFSPTFVIEETYPAVNALTMFGKKSIGPLIEAIGKENDELRLQLFCQVMVNIEGIGGAQKIIEKCQKNALATKNQSFKRAEKILREMKSGVAPIPTIKRKPP